MTDSCGLSSIQVSRFEDMESIARAREDGVLAAWEPLMMEDPFATVFQTPQWCLPWYRVYENQFSPRLLLLRSEGRLVGVLPLAVEKSSSRLVFAGATASDFHEVVSLPGYREFVLEKLTEEFQDGPFDHQLRFGPTQPDSPSVDLLEGLVMRRSGVRGVRGSIGGYRLWFNDSAAVEGLTKKKYVKVARNYFRRQGELSVERVGNPARWVQVKSKFFDHNTLLKLQGGKGVIFDRTDTLKMKAFYDALIRESPALAHLTLLRIDDGVVAEHFGLCWRGWLYFGPQGIDPRFRYSPGHVLLALMIQASAVDGELEGMDYTVGTTLFKRRFSNEAVVRPRMEVFKTSGAYLMHELRRRPIRLARRIVVSSRGEEAWSSLRGTLARRVASVQVASRRVLRSGESHGLAWVEPRERGSGIAMVSVSREALSTLPPDPSKDELRYDEFDDLLRWNGSERELTTVVNGAIKNVRAGYTLLTVMRDDVLLAWGFARRLEADEELSWRHGNEDSPQPCVYIGAFYEVGAPPGGLPNAILLASAATRMMEHPHERAVVACWGTQRECLRAFESIGGERVDVQRK